MSLADHNAHEGVLLIQGTATVYVQVCAFHNKSQPPLLGDYESSSSGAHYNLRLRLDNYLWLGLDNHLRLSGGYNNSGAATHAWCSHSNPFGTHVHVSASVELDEFFLGAETSENREWHGGFSNNLQRVSFVFDDDAQLVLEHIRGNFHELESPSGLFAAVMARRSNEVLLTDVYVANRRHFVERSTNLVVQLCVQNMEFEKTHWLKKILF